MEIEGKTKVVIQDPQNPFEADGQHKDIVTWNDTYREPMAGKGHWSNVTNANICKILKEAGEPVAFLRTTGDTTYRCRWCRMIRLEVVVRGEVDAKSSYLKRNPHAQAGAKFPEPVVEFFLKTDGPEWNGIQLPDTDPFITRYDETGIWVHHPKEPVTPEGEKFIPAAALGWDEEGMWPFERMAQMSRRSFTVIRSRFRQVGFDLKDWKEEYGYDAYGYLLHADIYDNDIWRLEDEDGREYSKQVIRNLGHAGIEAAKADYAFIAEITGRMRTLALLN